MPRINRVDVGGYVYHVLNRSNARVQIFDNDKDYKLFEQVLTEAKGKFDMPILSYSIMPNHWHLVLYPRKDGALSVFMKWLGNTHTKRWHSLKGTTLVCHLYQWRYKSFICQHDSYLLTLIRYVERNALKARLVKKAENWRWSSVWRRENGTKKEKKLLSMWPIEIPKNYLTILNEPHTEAEENAIEKSIQRDSPFGEVTWISRIINKFGLESTVNPRGRPKKGD